MRTANWLSIACVLAGTTAAAAPRRTSRAKAKAPVVEAPSEDADDEPIELELDDTSSDDETDEPDDDLEEIVPDPPKPRRKAHNELYFRAGVAHIEPRISSGGVTLEPVGIVKLAAPTEPMQGSIETDSANIFAATIGFAPAVFRGYLAFETIIGVPKKTKLRAKGDLATKSLAPTALGLVPTGIPPLGEELGEASAVPPMLTAVFRLPPLGPVRFYVGGGASVLFVKDAKITNEVLTEVATPKLEISPSFGVVAQAGVDVQLSGRFYARLDLKELWFQPSETRISNIHVRTTIPTLETIEVGSAKSEATANPLIVQFGIGASF